MCGLGFVGLSAREEPGWQTGLSFVGAVPAVSEQARLRNSQCCFLVGLFIRMGAELGKLWYSVSGTSLPGWHWYSKVDHVLAHGGRLC